MVPWAWAGVTCLVRERAVNPSDAGREAHVSAIVSDYLCSILLRRWVDSVVWVRRVRRACLLWWVAIFVDWI